MKTTYTIDEMKRAFECGRNFQLTGENNFQELIEELNQALHQPPVIRQVCTIGGECKVRGENNECKGTAYCGYKKHTFL